MFTFLFSHPFSRRELLKKHTFTDVINNPNLCFQHICVVQQNVLLNEGDYSLNYEIYPFHVIRALLLCLNTSKHWTLMLQSFFRIIFLEKISFFFLFVPWKLKILPQAMSLNFRYLTCLQLSFIKWMYCWIIFLWIFHGILAFIRKYLELNGVYISIFQKMGSKIRLERILGEIFSFWKKFFRFWN